MAGKIHSKKAKGRQRQMMLSSMVGGDYAMKRNDMLHAAREQRKWSDVTTYVHDVNDTQRDTE